MAAGLRVTVEGQAAIERALFGLVGKFEDPGEFMAGVGVYLESATIERFDGERAPDGSAWSKSIRAREEGGKTLTDSGQLRSSVTSNSTSRSVEVGTNKIYGGVHQLGATIKAKSADRLAFSLPGGLGFRRPLQVTIPARPYLGIGSEDETEILALADDFFAIEAGGTA